MPLILPQPEDVYSSRLQARHNELLRQADAENHKRAGDIEVGVGRRIILTSPDGHRHAVAVDNAGALVVTTL